MAGGGGRSGCGKSAPAGGGRAGQGHDGGQPEARGGLLLHCRMRGSLWRCAQHVPNFIRASNQFPTTTTSSFFSLNGIDLDRRKKNKFDINLLRGLSPCLVP